MAIENSNYALGITPPVLGVLFTLLIEGRHLTQEEIIEHTSLSRATVSDSLARLMAPESRLIVLQTRHLEDKHKYYYCPYGLDYYLKTIFKHRMEVSSFQNGLIDIASRVRKMDQSDHDIAYARDVLDYIIRVTTISQRVIDESERELPRDFKSGSRIQKIEFSPGGLHTTGNERDSLIQIKRDLAVIFLPYLSQVGRRGESIVIAIFLILNEKPVTQDTLIEETGYGRSTVSESLKELIDLQFVQTIKKPRDRKKYFKLSVRLSDISTWKFRLVGGGLSSLVTLIKQHFIPEIMRAEGDEEERARLSSFFYESAHCYEILLHHIQEVYSEISKTPPPNPAH